MNKYNLTSDINEKTRDDFRKALTVFGIKVSGTGSRFRDAHSLLLEECMIAVSSGEKIDPYKIIEEFSNGKN